MWHFPNKNLIAKWIDRAERFEDLIVELKNIGDPHHQIPVLEGLAHTFRLCARELTHNGPM